MTDCKTPITLDEFGQPVGASVPDWHGARRPERILLGGRFCRVEPLDAARHADALFAAHAAAPDGRHWAYLFQERPATRAAFDTLVAAQASGTDPLQFAVIDPLTERATGTLSLMRIDPAHGVIEVGHVNFAPAMQRTVAATEAQYLLMRHVFEDLGYRRYEWKCDSLNARSRTTALRLGFRFEGIFRQALVYKGRARDTAWFSVVDHEWAGLRAGFERWLSADNFAADGGQRRSLAQCRAGAH